MQITLTKINEYQRKKASSFMNVAKKNVTYESHERKTVIDHETGEVLREESVTNQRKRVETQDKFMQVYLDDIAPLINLKHKGAQSVLFAIWKLSTFNDLGMTDGNIFYLMKQQKEKISELTGLAFRSIENAITLLKKNNLIVPLKYQGQYMLNPEHFFKGALQDRPQVIVKYTKITYEIEENAKIKGKDPNQLEMFDDEGKELKQPKESESGKVVSIRRHPKVVAQTKATFLEREKKAN